MNRNRFTCYFRLSENPSLVQFSQWINCYFSALLSLSGSSVRILYYIIFIVNEWEHFKNNVFFFLKLYSEVKSVWGDNDSVTCVRLFCMESPSPFFILPVAFTLPIRIGLRDGQGRFLQSCRCFIVDENRRTWGHNHVQFRRLFHRQCHDSTGDLRKITCDFTSLMVGSPPANRRSRLVTRTRVARFLHLTWPKVLHRKNTCQFKV